MNNNITSEGTNFDSYKVVVIGDAYVGKTNIISRFTLNEFNKDSKATIGVDFRHSEIALADGSLIKIQIWDTAGTERFRAMMKGYYRGALGALIVFDITKASSFRNLEKWILELEQNVKTDVVSVLVGNKTDLKSLREVSTQEAKKYAEEKSLLYIETSALDGENIKEAFESIVNQIHEKKKRIGFEQKEELSVGSTVRIQSQKELAPTASYCNC